MKKIGTLLHYNIEEVTLMDINRLIDRGRRFDLIKGLDPLEYDTLEEKKDEV